MISARALKTLALGVSVLAAMTLPSAAETMTMWARAAAAAPAQGMIDLWNSTHEDKIELTVIPDQQVVTKLATAVQAGDVPDLMSFDLIFMPDFMKAGFLVDLTDLLKDDPNQAKVAQAFKDLATYEGKLYGTGFLPDVSILLWNKGLFKQAGLDPEKPPTTLDEVYEYAKKIRALGPDIYGYYLSGNCGGCNIFTQAPSMWGSGAHLLPKNGDDAALEGPGVKEMLTHLHKMWSEGIIPEGAQGDTGANFQAIFETGKVGMQGSGNFAIAVAQGQPSRDRLRHRLPSRHQAGERLLLRRRRPDRHSGRREEPRQGEGVRLVGVDRRSPAQGPRREEYARGPHRPCRERVLQVRAALLRDGEGGRHRPDAMGLPLQRHGQQRLEPVARDAADRHLRRQDR